MSLASMKSHSRAQALDGLIFDNRFIRELPGDPETSNHRRQVTRACYSRVQPARVQRPALVAYAREVAQDLNLRLDVLGSDEFVQVFSGNRLLDGMDPFAVCYGGHQFGSWAGQLGDGRVINLGEVINPQGERWTLQLKGAGPTPYSRMADGLAVLRSSVREFLCSEAMHHLGVPTTRALSLVLTGEHVIRDMFYDGNPKSEPGAVVCRVAPSFTRFGNFELFASRGETDILQKLADYTIRTDFPHLGEPSQATYIMWFEEICRKTAEMIVHWMRVGFVHGVLNTDNMSILGITIDYGPYGWLENFDPNWTPNTSDAASRRYRFSQQPQIALWNLAQFGNAIFPLIGQVKLLEQALDVYSRTFQRGWQSMLAQKLGLAKSEPGTDTDLGSELLDILQSIETDMTIFFRKLAAIGVVKEPLCEVDDDALISPLADAFYVPEQRTAEYDVRLSNWLRRYIARLHQDGVPNEVRRKRMNAVNPKYVLRNYLAQLATDKAEQGDNSKVTELHEVLRHPYDEQPDKEELAKKRPDWARHRAGCSMLSCSS